MSIIKRLFLASAVALFVIACAQTKSLTGGPKDEIAPQPIKMNPPNESVFFKNKSIEINFDEYVALNNPLQNISLVPNDAKLKTTLKDRTVKIDLEGELRENTTYSIFINKAIKDIHEGRDSIMQYVFSTGSHIDSFKYECYLLDAVTNSSINGATVGLFLEKDSLKPLYFTQSNNGKVTFNYLKEGEYFLRAFDDENKDGKIGKYEKMAFLPTAISIPQTGDTINLRFFQPSVAPDITHFSFTAPGMFTVGTNQQLHKDSVLLNNSPIDLEKTTWIGRDSLLIFDYGIENQSNQIKIRNGWVDSSRVRVNTTKSKFFALKESHKELTANDTFHISTSALITNFDSTKVKWTRISDTTAIPYRYEIIKNSIYFFPEVPFEKANLIISTEAVSTHPEWKNSPLNTTISVLKESEIGQLNINLSYYKEPIIIEMYNGKNLVKSLYINDVEQITFSQLKPAEYTFRIILDKNNNERWDTGNFTEELQPEEIHLYSSPVKVRGNWEMDVTLEPNKTNE